MQTVALLGVLTFAVGGCDCHGPPLPDLDAAPDGAPQDGGGPDAGGPEPCAEDGDVFHLGDSDVFPYATSRIAVDAARNVMVVWNDGAAVVARRCEAGEGWQPTETVGDGGEPELAMNRAGVAVAAFNFLPGFVGSPRAARYAPDVGWGAPSSLGSWWDSRVVVNDSGDSAVIGVFEDDVMCNDDRFIGSNTFAPGFGWRGLAPVPGASYPGQPEVAPGPESTFLSVFPDPVGCNADRALLWSTRFLPKSGWETPVVVASEHGLGPGDDHRLGTDAAGNGVEVWHAADDDAAWSARFDLAFGWHAPENVPGSNGVGPFALAVAPSGRALLAFVVADHVWATWSDASSTWEKPVELGAGSSSVDVAVDGVGGAVAVSVSAEGVWARRFDEASGWAEAVVVDDAGSGPRVAMSPDGLAAVAWGHGPGVYASILPRAAR